MHHCCGLDEGIAPVGLVLVRFDRPGGPSLSTVHVRGACGNHLRVPCTKKGDWRHPEKLFEGCSKSLLTEHLVQSRSVGELFMNYSPKKTKMTIRDQVGQEPVTRPSLMTKFGKLFVTGRSRPSVEGWS